MATDYAKKKNDELAALCKDRGLPHTGKKADLVKRLEDSDASTTTVVPAGAPAIEDEEIDWDDDVAPKDATTEPAADAIAAGGSGIEIPNPQNVPNQVAAVDPAATDELSVDPPAPVAAEEEGKAEEMDFSTGLADRTIDEEIEKRKARARKFGMPEDSDEIKALERAKKFGGTGMPGLLNKALPSDRKRGREVDGDGGIRKHSRGPAGKGGRGGRPGMGRRGSGRRDRERTPRAEGGGGHAGWMTAADREAAERRKAKFATS